MKITKEQLIKALEESGFKQTKSYGLWFQNEDINIEINVLLRILNKIPEKKEHKHNWQFVEEIWDYPKEQIPKRVARFVCPCGATKRVLEKEVEL